ncbi:MAG: hypothetical protein WA196_13115, partial [Pseudolabrys sp.]
QSVQGGTDHWQIDESGYVPEHGPTSAHHRRQRPSPVGMSANAAYCTPEGQERALNGNEDRDGERRECEINGRTAIGC